MAGVDGTQFGTGLGGTRWQWRRGAHHRHILKRSTGSTAPRTRPTNFTDPSGTGTPTVTFNVPRCSRGWPIRACRMAIPYDMQSRGRCAPLVIA